ncbi:hypothetical protein H072_3450 [Dactylellina haptotyla CBS 200.50]|uniref:Uncharacterized protein n=1 Tax=Dactylellina haptotyla (strain CBS 200.50) TaxID=1284197 RepID=S8BSZ5_DACHA|nr:hypothetical protein H072_3450 [Dactylellina haptotyla CBS 200.50]
MILPRSDVHPYVDNGKLTKTQIIVTVSIIGGIVFFFLTWFAIGRYLDWLRWRQYHRERHGLQTPSQAYQANTNTNVVDTVNQAENTDTGVMGEEKKAPEMEIKVEEVLVDEKPSFRV